MRRRPTPSASNIGKAYSDWIEQRYKDDQGPIGDMRMWGGGNWALDLGSGGTVRDKFNNETYPAYKLALALNNSNVPELRPWRFNTVANYDFSQGLLKGASVGGSYRWQDKNVTGFRLNAAKDGYDVGNPDYGPREHAFDMWIGYGRAITKRIHWRAQLNVRDVFASRNLSPRRCSPTDRPPPTRSGTPRDQPYEHV